MDRTDISRLGGQAVYRKYGKSHMSAIGKQGAINFWKKYKLVPCQQAAFALIERETGKFMRFINNTHI